MEKNFPCPIVSEKDLNIYEDYLRKSDGENRRMSESVRDGRCGYEVWIEKGAAKTGETKLCQISNQNLEEKKKSAVISEALIVNIFLLEWENNGD